MTDGGTMEHTNKMGQEGEPSQWEHLTAELSSFQVPLGCLNRSYFICSHKHTQFLPQTGNALTPLQLSVSHTQCLFLGKATSGVPTLKSAIPISSIRLDMFTANGFLTPLCPQQIDPAD